MSSLVKQKCTNLISCDIPVASNYVAPICHSGSSIICKCSYIIDLISLFVAVLTVICNRPAALHKHTALFMLVNLHLLFMADFRGGTYGTVELNCIYDIIIHDLLKLSTQEY